MGAPNRVQAGVPTGGQFAPSAHAEADVHLAETQPEVRDTPGLADAHAAVRRRVSADLARAERISAQLTVERVAAHHPDAASVHLATGDQDGQRFLYVSEVRDADGQAITLSREVEDELNGFADDFDPRSSSVTIYDDADNLDVLLVARTYLREGDLS